MNIFKIFKEIFSEVIIEISKQHNIEINKSELEKFTVEPTKEKSHGDISCNISMVFSKKFQTIPTLNNPRKLAEEVIKKLNNHNIEKVEVAGAGFINLFLNNKIYHQLVKNLVEENFSFPNLGNKQKINLEYASPNPTGPIHVGHTRGAIYGDVLANLLLKTGFDVLKEYYINDAGAQIETLLKSAFLRYKEACGQKIEIPEGLYPGDYLIDIGQKLKAEYGEKLLQKDEAEVLVEIRDFVVLSMVELIKTDLLALGIKHDSYFFEKENLHDTNKISQAISVLEKQGLIFEGKLEAPKTEKGVGAITEDYDDQTQTLFRSSDFGDDQDRVVKKHDGNFTYFAGDLAYTLSKFERGATMFIMPLGYDHAGYVKRLTSAVKALTNDQAQLKVILCQLVKFVKNGEPLKMSKRAGNFITAREVIDEVGADVLRFIMLTRKNDAPFDFDLAKVIEQSKDNPIFYVQYAHARCCSILRNLENENIKIPNILSAEVLENLKEEEEISLIKKISNFERTIEMAVKNFEPHRIAFYLQDLAKEFHYLWSRGSENPDLKFILTNDIDKTLARIYLVLATKKIIATGLDIFNIKAVNEMK